MLLSLSLLLYVVTRTCQRPSCICTVLYLRAVYTQAWERHLLDNLRIFGFGYQSTPRENQEVRPWTNFRQYCAPASTQEILLSNKRRLTSVSRLTYQEARVTEVREVEKTGFFSPFTVCGDIEVVSNDMNSGVIASIYSDWFLEGLGVDPFPGPPLFLIASRSPRENAENAQVGVGSSPIDDKDDAFDDATDSACSSDVTSSGAVLVLHLAAANQPG
jgi:hypothetical protein